jgi:hypothetical protein
MEASWPPMIKFLLEEEVEPVCCGRCCCGSDDTALSIDVVSSDVDIVDVDVSEALFVCIVESATAPPAFNRNVKKIKKCDRNMTFLLEVSTVLFLKSFWISQTTWNMKWKTINGEPQIL